MTKMIALRDTHYKGRTVKAGEVYEVRDEYVKILISAKAARVANEAPSSKRYQRRDMRAEK